LEEKECDCTIPPILFLLKNVQKEGVGQLWPWMNSFQKIKAQKRAAFYFTKKRFGQLWPWKNSFQKGSQMSDFSTENGNVMA